MSKKLEITLELPSLRALFETPEVTPFSSDYRAYSYTSGVEYLADQLYGDRRIDSIDATFVLPADEVAGTSEQEVATAIGRYRW